MPYIVKGFAQEKLIPAVDLVKLINQYVSLKKSGANYTACCPFHNEKTPSFFVSPSRNIFKCFGCGEYGNALDFIMKYKNIDYVEAVEELAHYAGIEVEYEKSNRGFVKQAEDKNKKLYELMDRAAHYFTSQLELNPAAKEYFVKERGLSEDLIVKARLGFAPDSWDYVEKVLARSHEEYQLCVELGLQVDRFDESKGKHSKYPFFRGRVMFPIFDKKGRIIAFGGRVFNHDFGPKYLNSPESPIFKKRTELFGLYETLQAHRNRPEKIVVVEGYMDAIALRQAGFDYVVATLGTAITQVHLKTLFRFTDEVICCFDGDEAGKTATWRAIKAITPVLDDPKKEIRFINLPAGHDPDTLIRAEGKEAFEKEIKMSVSYSECILLHESILMDVSEPSARIRFINSILSIIKAMKSPPIQIVTLQMLADYVGMTLSTVQDMFNNESIEPNQEFMQPDVSDDYVAPGHSSSRNSYVTKGRIYLPSWANTSASSQSKVVTFTKRNSNYQAQNDYIAAPIAQSGPNYQHNPNNVNVNAQVFDQSHPMGQPQGANMFPPYGQVQVPGPGQGMSQGPGMAQGMSPGMANNMAPNVGDPRFNHQLWPEGMMGANGQALQWQQPNSAAVNNGLNQGGTPWGSPDYSQNRNYTQGRQLSPQEINQQAIQLNIARNQNSPAGEYMTLGPSGAPLNAGNQMRNQEFTGEYFEGGRGPQGNLMYQSEVGHQYEGVGAQVATPNPVDLYALNGPNFTVSPQERVEYKSVVGLNFTGADLESHSYRLISFILQYPTIVANYYSVFIIDDMLALAKELKIVEYPCLQRLLTLIKSKPTITCAGIIEEYRGTDFEPLFNFLISIDLFKKNDENPDQEELNVKAKAAYLAEYIFDALSEPLNKRMEYLQQAMLSGELGPQMLEEVTALQKVMNMESANSLAKMISDNPK